MLCNERVLGPHFENHDITRASKGHDLPYLKALKTVEELRAGDALVEVYVTRIPAKASSRVLDALKTVSPENGFDFQHIRRFSKIADIPPHLDFLLVEDVNEGSTGPSLFLILGTTKEFTIQLLETIFRDTLGLSTFNGIHTVTVPLLAPTSQEQAYVWTKKYWPTVYKKSNPYGPHPSIVYRAEQQMVRDVGGYMALASQAAREVETEHVGEAIGAIIVLRQGDKSQPVCLASDARWKGIEPRVGPGIVMAHAVMRVIGMVAQKLKALDSKKKLPDSADITKNRIFMDLPLTALEKSIFDKHEIAADGYLCHNLEIYMTHEPCVMCCMAILHSRFGRVVFSQRMPKTGGMCAESSACHGSDNDLGLGLGLFWRKELNWSLLGWQWVESETDSSPISPDIQV